MATGALTYPVGPSIPQTPAWHRSCNDILHYVAVMYERRPGRRLVQVWMLPKGVERLDQLAEDTETDRSTVIRACLVLALADPGKIIAKIERDREAGL